MGSSWIIDCLPWESTSIICSFQFCNIDSEFINENEFNRVDWFIQLDDIFFGRVRRCWFIEIYSDGFWPIRSIQANLILLETNRLWGRKSIKIGSWLMVSSFIISPLPSISLFHSLLMSEFLFSISCLVLNWSEWTSVSILFGFIQDVGVNRRNLFIFR